MESEPLITIITPFLNAEKYLSETIESVFSQTYAQWELLLIDDGSTDKSTGIAKKYALNYPDKIKYFEHNDHVNLGKSISRNLGIQNAKGFYITFLDADDVFLPFKLETQLHLLNQFPDAAMVFGVTEYWNSWDNSGNKDYTPELGLKPGFYKPPELALFFLKYSHYTPCLCSFLVSRNTLNQLERFDENIHDLFEDQVLIYKVCLNENVLADKGCNERYRQHPESTSAMAILNKQYHPVKPSSSRLIFLKWLKRYIEERRINNSELDKLIKKELRVFEYPLFYSFYLPAKNIVRKIKLRLLISSS